MPEADREVSVVPSAFVKSQSIEGIPVGRFKQVVKCDVSGSTPIRLIVSGNMSRLDPSGNISQLDANDVSLVTS